MKVSRLCTDIPRAATSAWALHTALPLFDSNTSSLAESAAHRLPHSKMQKATENEGCGVKCCLQRVAAKLPGAKAITRFSLLTPLC